MALSVQSPEFGPARLLSELARTAPSAVTVLKIEGVRKLGFYEIPPRLSREIKHVRFGSAVDLFSSEDGTSLVREP
jgi:hypothetical protein